MVIVSPNHKKFQSKKSYESIQKIVKKYNKLRTKQISSLISKSIQIVKVISSMKITFDFQIVTLEIT